jgi:hypothetical protein
MHDKHYRGLFYMALLSFIAMYVLMYSMVNTYANVYPNLNQFYRADLMAAPMVIIELLVMRSMYANKKLNALIIVLSAGVSVAFFACIQKQAAIGDEQFLKSMIPHHAAAILMCQDASIQDPEIKVLCANIMSGQQAEIDQMKAKLNAFPRE